MSMIFYIFAEMKFIGAHVSVSPSVAMAPLHAKAIGAKAFALFTRSPQRWQSKPLSEKIIAEFHKNCADLGYTPDVILPHDSFLINLGCPDPEKLALSRDAFLDEMHRAEQLGLKMVNFHPGAHIKQCSEDECLGRIAESINQTLAVTTGVYAVIENTAGMGSNLGYTFGQIARIIELVDDKSRVGVCIDTCHALAAGYDLATADGYEKTWQEFDEIIGISYLRGMHLNDSKKPLSSHIDRHESIGRGYLGTEFWWRLINDPRFDNIPLILETPVEELWPEEIKWLYSLQGIDITDIPPLPLQPLPLSDTEQVLTSPRKKKSSK